jgi:hypothetical protein
VLAVADRPITVTSSPLEGWRRAPTDSMRSMTWSTSCSEADGFMTIIIGGSFPVRLEKVEGPALA